MCEFIQKCEITDLIKSLLGMYRAAKKIGLPCFVK